MLAGQAWVWAMLVVANSLLAGLPESPKRPNILLLMTDQHRGDCLGADGNRVIHTPNLDRLAREGALFKCAYSATPTCTPARAALLTGLSPWHHGMLGYGRVAEHYPMELPALLGQAGYQTLGIGKMHWAPQRALHGFQRTLLDESGRVEDKAFESDYRAWFRLHAPPGVKPDDTGLGWNDYRAKAYVLPEALHPTHWIAQTAIDYLENYREPGPFFLKVSFERPHSPYDPPQRLLDTYREEDMPAPWVGDWAAKHAVKPAKPDPSLWQGDLGVEQARQSRRAYYASVSFIDEQIGRILQVLEKRGWLDQTFILMTADHGDMLGDHHLWRKSYAYEGSARIPFLVRWPASLALKRGQVIRNPVEIRDILPTFLEVAGQKPPADLDGRSVLALLRGDAAGWRPWIDLEHNICYSPANNYSALTDGRFKYIYHAQKGEEQLFNLLDDPGELHDLAKEPQDQPTLREWRRRLVAHLQERGAPFVMNGDLAPRPKGMLYSPHYPVSK